MKNLIVIFLLAATFSVQAQQETVFGKFRNWGAFGSLNYEYGLKKTQFTSTAGGGFGLVIGTVFIGGYGNSSGNLDDVIQDEPFLDLAHGGLWLGFTPLSKKLFHPIASLRLGTGAVDVDLADNKHFKKDFVSVITPELGVELNITKIFRLAVTGNYRFVRGIEAANPRTNKDYEGLNIAVGLRIGWFGRWRSDKCNRGKSKIKVDISRDMDMDEDSDKSMDKSEPEKENKDQQNNQNQSTEQSEDGDQ